MEQATLVQDYVSRDEAAVPLVTRIEPSIIFRVPESFDYRRELPPDLQEYKDDAHWLLDNVGSKCAFDDTDEDGYAHLYSGILRRVMSKRYYAEVRKALIERGWIELSRSYSPGRYSKGYRIGKEHLSERCKTIKAEDRGIIKRVQRERARMSLEQKRLWLPIHHQLADILGELRILPSVDAVLETLADDVRLGQDILVGYIRDRNPRFKVGNTGRCYTALTGLKRTLRPYLRLAGEPLGGLDIKSAQPALLVNLIAMSEGSFVPTYIQRLIDRLIPDSCARSSYWSASGGPGLMLVASADAPGVGSDFALFADLVADGRLHDCLIELCRADGLPLPGDSDYVAPRLSARRRRDPPQNPKEFVKIMLMQDVLAKKGFYPSDFERIFKQKFPTVQRYIRWFNESALCYPKPQYSELIRVLQRLESNLVIEHVAPRLVNKSIPILSLHDAIYCRESDVGIVRNAFYETFAELGLRMEVKDEFVCAAV